MDATFTFRNTEGTEALKGRTSTKLAKLQKYLNKPVSPHVIFKIDGVYHTVEITFQHNGVSYFSKGESNDMYTSLDDAVSKIEHQLRKTKDRIKGHKGE